MSYETLLAILAALAFTLLQSFFSSVKHYYDKRSDAFDDISKIVLELKIEVKHIQEKVEELTRLKKDIDVLFSKMRSSSNGVSSNDDSQ